MEAAVYGGDCPLVSGEFQSSGVVDAALLHCITCAGSQVMSTDPALESLSLPSRLHRHYRLCVADIS